MVQPPKKPPVNVAYVGSDSGFFLNVMQRFKSNYGAINFEFPKVEVKGVPERLLLQIMKLDPKIIYLDFCEDREKVLRIAEIASRDPFFHEVPIVGLVDKKEDTLACLGAGADFIYVKGGEFHDLVYAPMNIAFPKQVVKPKFATAKMSEEVDLVDDFRVGFIAPTYIHVEGNFYLEEGATVFFKNGIDRKTLPSQNFEVKNRSEQNLYYDFNYSYDLEFKYVDPPEITDEGLDDANQIEDEKERIKALKAAKHAKREKLAEFEENYKRSQKKLKDWVIDQMDGKKEKKTKLLIVDESMRVFSQVDGESLDKTPYSIRFQTQMDQSFIDLDKQRPAILAYQTMGEYGPDVKEEFDIARARLKDPEGEGMKKHADPEKEKLIAAMVEQIPDREKEEMSYISLMVSLVKEMDNYSPIVVLFGCYFQTSKALQESLQYPMLVTHEDNLSLDVCLNLAKIYETRQDEKMDKLIKDKVRSMKAKDPNKFRRLSEDDFREKKYFVRKSNSLSYGSIKNAVILKTLNESEITFATELHLPMKTYRLHYPLDLSIHLVPIEEGKDFLDEKGLKTYRGIIHSISENDKKSLRQHVNEVFFEPLKEKREAEAAQFAELNAQAKKDRDEDDKMSEEQKEKLAQEILGLDQSVTSETAPENPEEENSGES